MRPADIKTAEAIEKKLLSFKIRPLPGIASAQARSVLVRQIVDSIRRIEYVIIIRDKKISPLCADSSSIAFDPLKAASWHIQNGNSDEACWLVFLSIHFGKNLRTKWRLVQDFYGDFGKPVFWDWQTVCANLPGFKSWLYTKQGNLKQNGKFGNHRKYQSIDAYKPNGTGVAIESYVNWIGISHNHQTAFNNLISSSTNEREAFDILYQSMNAVISFGRTAKFDYLTMIGKLKLANIEPGLTYMHGATGPLQGSHLLFGTIASPSVLNDWLIELETHLGLYFGMQVLEDAICNWQKDTTTYVYFGG